MFPQLKHQFSGNREDEEGVEETGDEAGEKQITPEVPIVIDGVGGEGQKTRATGHHSHLGEESGLKVPESGPWQIEEHGGARHEGDIQLGPQPSRY